MMYRRIESSVEAVQYTNPADLPPLCGLDSGGKCVVRTSDMSHETVRIRDYVVYPGTERDADGELRYPEVWYREQFERTFEAE